MKILKKILFFTLLISPFALAVSPDILPDPYYQYEISGKVTRKNGGSLKNFTIALMGKSKVNLNFVFIHQYQSELVHIADQPISLTDDYGSFFIRTSSKIGAMDSLALCVIFYDKDNFINSSFISSIVKPDVVNQSFNYSNESGCSCQNTTSSETVVVGYYYKYINSEIQIPF